LLPEGARPNRLVDVAGLEFDKHLGPHLRHGKKPLVGQAAEGQAG
jgi:hypothetical protein